MTTFEALVKAYPSLATTVAGEAPLAFAITEWAEGRCATMITERDLCDDDVALSGACEF